MYENVQTLQFGSNPEPTVQINRHQANVGGITTYDVPVEAHQPLISHNPIQQNIGSVLTVGVNGSSHSSGVQTVSTASLNPGQSNFLDTARNSGMPAMGNLTPDTVVNFSGIEVDLATLEAMGEVKRTATGYELPGQDRGVQHQQAPNQEQQQQAQQSNLSNGIELFATEVEQNVARAIDPIPQVFYDAAVASAIENGLEGININDVAYHSGMSPDQVRQAAEMISNAFSQQADSVAKSNGIENPAEVWDWAMAERNEQFMDARRQLAIGRNPSALKALVNEYYASVPPTTEALQKAGVQLRMDHTGETVALIRGNWMTPAAAARAGLI